MLTMKGRQMNSTQLKKKRKIKTISTTLKRTMHDSNKCTKQNNKRKLGSSIHAIYKQL